MPFTVQLDLDSAANAALDGLAERLEALPGLTTIRRLGDVHHLSLSVSTRSTGTGSTQALRASRLRTGRSTSIWGRSASSPARRAFSTSRRW